MVIVIMQFISQFVASSVRFWQSCSSIVKEYVRFRDRALTGRVFQRRTPPQVPLGEFCDLQQPLRGRRSFNLR